jgi:septum formation protein
VGLSGAERADDQASEAKQPPHVARDVITIYEPSVPRPLTPETPLLLGSASPRRRELLASAGVPLMVLAPKVDEALRAGEAPAIYLERIAAAKLDAAASAHASAVRAGASRAAGAILVADTMVTKGGVVLDKPDGPEAARAALEALSGQTHEVATRFLVGDPEGAANGPARVLHGETVRTEVTFRALAAREIDAYVSGREGLDKAGGYGIQGGAAGFVSRIEGSYTSVVGLPLAEVLVALRRLGLWS